MKAVFARPGTVIPVSGEALKIGTIRGVESRGMLCSARELLLGDDHDGIIELAADAVVGEPAAKALGLTDPVIDVSHHAQSRRCDERLWHRARSGGGRSRHVCAKAICRRCRANSRRPIKTALDFPPATADACPMFAGRLIRGVKNGPSPKWLQDWLKAVGLRPISALVDVTNFISLDRGRPLHVFDAGKLKGNLRARFAKDGEQLLALDGKTYTLDSEMVVIADDEAARGIGGVMGGEDIVLHRDDDECVHRIRLFDPIRIARAGPQARHRLGCALSLRARRRSGIRRAGSRTRDQDDPELLRRRTVAKLSSRAARRTGSATIAFDPGARARSSAVSMCRRARSSRILTRLGFAVEDGAIAEGHAAVLAQRRRRQRRSGRRGRAHPRPRQGAVGRR